MHSPADIMHKYIDLYSSPSNSVLLPGLILFSCVPLMIVSDTQEILFLHLPLLLKLRCY